MFLPRRYPAKGGGDLAECEGDSSRGELEGSTNPRGNAGLAVGKGSKQVPRAAAHFGTFRNPRGTGKLWDIWRNTGCRGVVLERRLLDSKRDWQAQGEKSDRFQPEGTAQALTHSPLMINIPPLHHHTCQIHQEHHRARAVLSTAPNALRDSTKLSGCRGNPKTPLPFATHSPEPFPASAAQFVIRSLELFPSHRHKPPGLLLLLFSPG